MLTCCPNIALTCDVCYPFSSNAEGVISIPVNLYGTYFVWVKDKFGNWYNDVAISYGSLLINTADFPSGLFSYGDSFDIFLSSDIAGKNVVTFSISLTVYKCVILTINQPTYRITEDGCNLRITEDGQNYLQTQ